MTDTATAPEMKPKSRMLTVCENIQAMTPKFQAALPAHIPPEKFVRTVLTTLQLNPDIANCDPTSIYNECIKAAADGLIVDGREAALVKYNVKKKVNGVDQWVDSAKYMPMVAGLLKKARNSGEISSIVGRCVYANDKFHVIYGDDEKLTHEPCLDGEPGPVRLAYMVARLKDGGIVRHIMTLKEINKRREASRSKDAGPWGKWFDEMCVKTVLRGGSKFLPASSDRADFGALIERDDDLYDLDGVGLGGAVEPGDLLGQASSEPRQRRPRQGRTAGAAMNGAAPPAEPTDLVESIDSDGVVSMVPASEAPPTVPAEPAPAATAAPVAPVQPEPVVAQAPKAAAAAAPVNGLDDLAPPAFLKREAPTQAAKPAPVTEASPPPPTDDDVI